MKHSFEEVREYLGLNTEILVSSGVAKDNSLKAQNRIIAINQALGATRYINAIGGQKLYDKEAFAKVGIKLDFIEMQHIKYKQFKGEFVPNLSMIDVLMFNSKQDVIEMLNSFELI